MPGASARWGEAQAASDQLWQVLRPTAFYERPVAERHRLVFYLGHLEAFDWNLLAPALELERFRPDWDQLFAFGIDPVEGALPAEPASAWPAVGNVLGYNHQLRRRLGEALAQRADASPEPELAQRLEVAIEHRWMHVETLSYLLHNLGYEHKMPGPAPANGGRKPPRTDPVPVPAGMATLGQTDRGAFGWDNEFAAQRIKVGSFTADRHKVTNREYLAFVAAGAAPPHFWRRVEGGWRYRGMFAEVPLPLDHPVYVTHEQASAYAAWRGARLPSEAEWHRLAYGTPAGEERSYPWGERAPAGAGGNFDLRQWDPAPVDAHPESASAWGAEDLVGNGWEWTATPFAPFPGFVPLPFYPGYSANFFDGRHFVMKGGSARTAACLLRRSFRNWFQPRYPYVYAGFRCVS
jgi:iron(II)-dependent oxidoreductase